MSGIKDLLSGGQMVAYYPALARAIGGIAPALFLQQIAHWSGSTEDGWVYRKQEQLEEELAMSAKTQATCRKHLIEGGFMKEERRAKNRLHYKIEWEKVEAELQSLPTGRSRVSQPAGLESPDGRNSLNKSKDKSKDKSSPKGADAPQETENLANYYTTLTVSRTQEVDFEATPRQKNAWADGFNRYVYVEEGETPPEPEDVMRWVNKIVDSASEGYFLSVKKARERTSSNQPNGRASPHSNGVMAPSSSVKEGYEWLFE